MEITDELLHELGFTGVPNRPYRYQYKQVTGRLDLKTGHFYFHGFSMPIYKVADLQYMLMLIDYQFEATFKTYPISDN